MPEKRAALSQQAVPLLQWSGRAAALSRLPGGRRGRRLMLASGCLDVLAYCSQAWHTAAAPLASSSASACYGLWLLAYC